MTAIQDDDVSVWIKKEEEDFDRDEAQILRTEGSSETASIESENASSETWAIKCEAIQQAEDRNPQSFDEEDHLTVMGGPEGIPTSKSAGDVKSHSCKYCDFRCATSTHLGLHVMSVHSVERPFARPDCSYSCAQSSNLRRHVRSVHEPPTSAEDSISKKRLTCPFCAYSCAQSGNLKSHIAFRHTREKPYVCAHCGYRSSQSSNLKRHVKLRHSGSTSPNLTRIEQARDLQAISENPPHKFVETVQGIGRPHFSAENHNPTHSTHSDKQSLQRTPDASNVGTSFTSAQPQDERFMVGLHCPLYLQQSRHMKSHEKLRHSHDQPLESTNPKLTCNPRASDENPSHELDGTLRRIGGPEVSPSHCSEKPGSTSMDNSPRSNQDKEHSYLTNEMAYDASNERTTLQSVQPQITDEIFQYPLSDQFSDNLKNHLLKLKNKLKHSVGPFLDSLGSTRTEQTDDPQACGKNAFHRPDGPLQQTGIPRVSPQDSSGLSSAQIGTSKLSNNMCNTAHSTQNNQQSLDTTERTSVSPYGPQVTDRKHCDLSLNPSETPITSLHKVSPKTHNPGFSSDNSNQALHLAEKTPNALNTETTDFFNRLQVTDKRPFKCPFCDHRSSQSGNLKSHIAFRHTREKPFACNHCAYKSSQSSNLKRHLILRHSSNPSNSSKIEQLRIFQDCVENVSDEPEGKVKRIESSHVRPQDSSELRPEQNGTNWHDFFNRTHNAEHSSQKKQRSLHTNEINSRTSNGEPSVPSKGPQVTLRTLKCPFCDHRSSQSGNLKTHIAFRHTGEKPFICNHCDYKSSQSSNLKRHMVLRHSSDPYLGSPSPELTRIKETRDPQGCDERSSHGFDGTLKEVGRPWSPPPNSSGKHFTHHGFPPQTYNSLLSRNKQPLNSAESAIDASGSTPQPHFHEKRYRQCPFCDYRSNQSSNLKTHVAFRHSKVKPYGCPHCTYRSSQSSNINRHVRFKHATPPMSLDRNVNVSEVHSSTYSTERSETEECTPFCKEDTGVMSLNSSDQNPACLFDTLLKASNEGDPKTETLSPIPFQESSARCTPFGQDELCVMSLDSFDSKPVIPPTCIFDFFLEGPCVIPLGSTGHKPLITSECHSDSSSFAPNDTNEADPKTDTQSPIPFKEPSEQYTHFGQDGSGIMPLDSPDQKPVIPSKCLSDSSSFAPKNEKKTDPKTGKQSSTPFQESSEQCTSFGQDEPCVMPLDSPDHKPLIPSEHLSDTWSFSPRDTNEADPKTERQSPIHFQESSEYTPFGQDGSGVMPLSSPDHKLLIPSECLSGTSSFAPKDANETDPKMETQSATPFQQFSAQCTPFGQDETDVTPFDPPVHTFNPPKCISYSSSSAPKSKNETDPEKDTLSPIPFQEPSELKPQLPVSSSDANPSSSFEKKLDLSPQHSSGDSSHARFENSQIAKTQPQDSFPEVLEFTGTASSSSVKSEPTETTGMNCSDFDGTADTIRVESPEHKQEPDNFQNQDVHDLTDPEISSTDTQNLPTKVFGTQTLAPKDEQVEYTFDQIARTGSSIESENGIKLEDEIKSEILDFPAEVCENLNEPPFSRCAEKQFECHFCDYKSSQASNVRTHIAFRHTKFKPFACPFCNYRSSQSSNVKRHMRFKHASPLSCIRDFQNSFHDALSSYAFFEDLDNQTAQNDTGRFSETLPPDSVNTFVQSALEKPDTSVSSSIINYQTTNASSEVPRDPPQPTKNSTEKQYRCPFCPHRTIQSGNMKTHIAFRHLKVKPYGCPFCAYRSSQSSNVNRHLRFKHPDQMQNGYVRPERYSETLSLENEQSCYETQTFSTIDACRSPPLFVDTQIDQPEEKLDDNQYLPIEDIKQETEDYEINTEKNESDDYQNDLHCTSDTYLESTHWDDQSSQIQNDRRQYQCPYCDHRTNQSGNLKTHIAFRHSKVKPFGCPFCTYQSSQSSNVQRHVRFRHPDQTSWSRRGLKSQAIAPYNIRNSSAELETIFPLQSSFNLPWISEHSEATTKNTSVLYSDHNSSALTKLVPTNAFHSPKTSSEQMDDGTHELRSNELSLNAKHSGAYHWSSSTALIGDRNTFRDCTQDYQWGICDPRRMRSYSTTFDGGTGVSSNKAQGLRSGKTSSPHNGYRNSQPECTPAKRSDKDYPPLIEAKSIPTGAFDGNTTTQGLRSGKTSSPHNGYRNAQPDYTPAKRSDYDDQALNERDTSSPHLTPYSSTAVLDGDKSLRKNYGQEPRSGTNYSPFNCGGMTFPDHTQALRSSRNCAVFLERCKNAPCSSQLSSAVAFGTDSNAAPENTEDLRSNTASLAEILDPSSVAFFEQEMGSLPGNRITTTTSIGGLARVSNSTYDTRSTSSGPNSCSPNGQQTYRTELNPVQTCSSGSHKEKSFVCPQCPYRCAQSSNLKTHIAFKHSKHKPFGCTHCSYRTCQSSNLKRHILLKHNCT